MSVRVSLTYENDVDLADHGIEIPEGMTEEQYALDILNGKCADLDDMDTITNAVLAGGSLSDWTVNDR